MGQLVGGIAGAVVGSFFGAPQLGFAIGSAIGGALGPKPPAPAVGSLAPTEVEYGWGIPIIEGTRRAATWRLWQSDLEAVDERVETKGSSSRTVGYRYRCNMGLLICRRGVGATVRIWRNKEMVATFRTDATDEAIAASVESIHWQLATFYAGGDDQLPHPVYEAALGDVPAYVGWATLWIDGAWCEGRTPPAIEVEVTTGPQTLASVEMWRYQANQISPNITPEPGSIDYTNAGVVPVKLIDRFNWGSESGYGGAPVFATYAEATAWTTATAPGAFSGAGRDVLWVGEQSFITTLIAGNVATDVWHVPGLLEYTTPPTYTVLETYVVGIQYGLRGEVFTPATWSLATKASASGASVGQGITNYGASDEPWVSYMDDGGATVLAVSGPPPTLSVGYIVGGSAAQGRYAKRGALFFFAQHGSGGQARIRRFTVGVAAHTHESALYTYGGGFGTFRDLATDGTTVWVPTSTGIQPLSAADLSSAGAEFAGPAGNGRIFVDSANVLHSLAGGVLYSHDGAAWTALLDLTGTDFNETLMTHSPGFEGGTFYATQPVASAAETSAWRGLMSLSPTTPTGVQLNTILSRYMQACGIAASQINLTETVGIEVPGYTAQGSGKYVIDELSTAYYFNLVNDGRYLRTRLRGQASVATIEYADLGVGVDQAEAEPLEADTDSAVEVPRRISVSAANGDSDHQVETQTDDRLVGPNVQTDSISLALSETPDRIKGMANTIAADRKTGANTGKFAVGLDWIELELGDVVNVVGRQGELRRVRLVRETFADWVRQFEWSLDRVADIQTAGIVTASGSPPTLTLQSPGSAEVLPLDSPLERDADNAPGQYVAVDLRGGAGLAGVYHATTEAGAFESAGTVSIEAKVGTLLTTLRAWDGHHGWDAYSTFDVLMADGATLTGSTKAAMHANLSINNLLIGSTARGWERARFVSASLIATDTYRVSVMLRAQKGSETLAYSHIPGERIVVLARDGFLSQNLDLSQVGTHWWKAVAPGRNVSTTPSVSSPFTSVRTKPLAPTHLRAVRDAAGNITLTWSPRTRFGTNWRSAVFPNSELVQSYRVEAFVFSPDSSPVRTQTVSTPEFAYTAAQQATDGVFDPARVAFRITTLGPSGQPGYPLESVI